MSDKLLKKIKDEEIKFVDLRFTDPKGKMQHVTFHSDLVDEDLFKDGTMFDGSSIGGWKDINESDMVLLPDAETAQMDPFYQQDTLAVFCDILEPDTGESYNRDPRGTAKAAEAYMRSAKVGDDVFLDQKQNFLFLMTCDGILVKTKLVMRSTQLSYHQTRADPIKEEIWAIDLDQRVDTSLYHRWTAFKICGLKCFQLWKN